MPTGFTGTIITNKQNTQQPQSTEKTKYNGGFFNGTCSYSILVIGII